MANGDVTTHSNRGQWENVVDGQPELSASFTTREEAVEQGRTLADRLGTQHVIQESEGDDTAVGRP